MKTQSEQFSVPPFRLPLNQAEFSRALQTGHGRALLHAKEFGIDGFEQAVVHACTHDFSYDPQLEDCRVDWMMKLLDAASATDRLAPAIVKAAARANESEDIEEHHWDWSHRCCMLFQLAQRAVPGAKETLYRSHRRLRKDVGFQGRFLGSHDIVELDGEAGLIFVTDAIGRAFQEDPSVELEMRLLDHFDEGHGKGRAVQILQAAAKENPRIKTFLEELDRQKSADAERRKNRSAERRLFGEATVEELIQHITHKSYDSMRALRGWGRQAAPEQLERLANELFRQHDPTQIKAYLWIFQVRALPQFDPRFLPLAEHDSPEVRRLNMYALSHYAHPAVRDLALKRIAQETIGEAELLLLKQNYVQGDFVRLEALMESMLQSSLTPFQLHSVLFDLQAVLDSQELDELSGLALFHYEHTPCSVCRARAVEWLQEMGQLPGWVSAEYKFDSNSSNRDGTEDMMEPAEIG